MYYVNAGDTTKAKPLLDAGVNINVTDAVSTIRFYLTSRMASPHFIEQ